MGRYLILFGFVMAFLFPASLASADNGDQQNIPRLFGTFIPKAGAWSEYAIFDKSTGKRTVMRMSIVGVEGDSYWYEVVNREEGSSNIVKMLVKGDPNDPENIQRLIMKSGTKRAEEMPRDFVLMGRRMATYMFEQRSGIPLKPAVKLKNVKRGEGTVTVPAGTFDVSLHEIVDVAGRRYAEYKFSDTVHPFGVVSSNAENSAMVLVGFGDDAKSLITEEPVMMTRPPGMPDGMPRGVPPGMNPYPEKDMDNTIRPVPGMGRGYEQ